MNQSIKHSIINTIQVRLRFIAIGGYNVPNTHQSSPMGSGEIVPPVSVVGGEFPPGEWESDPNIAFRKCRLLSCVLKPGVEHPDRHDNSREP